MKDKNFVKDFWSWLLKHSLIAGAIGLSVAAFGYRYLWVLRNRLPGGVHSNPTLIMGSEVMWGLLMAFMYLAFMGLRRYFHLRRAK